MYYLKFYISCISSGNLSLGVCPAHGLSTSVCALACAWVFMWSALFLWVPWSTHSKKETNEDMLAQKALNTQRCRAVFDQVLIPKLGSSGWTIIHKIIPTTWDSEKCQRGGHHSIPECRILDQRFHFCNVSAINIIRSDPPATSLYESATHLSILLGWRFLLWSNCHQGSCMFSVSVRWLFLWTLVLIVE